MPANKVNIPGNMVNKLLHSKKCGFLRFWLPYYNKASPSKKISGITIYIPTKVWYNDKAVQTAHSQ